MGVFDILPGLGGDEAGAAESADDAGDAGGGVGDQTSLADLGPGDFRERAEALTGRSDVPTLDFTVESLASLDDLAAGPPSAVDDRVAYGSYLGETIVREFGGEWTDEGDWQVAVELPDDRTTIAVFDAAEMSIAEEPVFVKVVDHLQAQGAERTPDVSEETGTGAGGAANADQEPTGGLGDADVTDAGGDAATFGVDEDGDADDPPEPDTVVVDDPVAVDDGQPGDAGSVGDGATATDDATATDGTTAADDGTDSDVDVDSDGPDVATGADGDDDASSTNAPFVPDSVDSAVSAGDDDRPAPDRSDDETGTDVDLDGSHGESGVEETDSEDDASDDSGLLSSGVLPFGGGSDDVDDASDATDDRDDTGVTGDGATSDTDGDAPTAARDDEDAVSGDAIGSDAGDATGSPDGAVDSSGDEAGEGDADASVDDGPAADDLGPTSSGDGYSTTDFSPEDDGLGTDGDDESAVAADFGSATADSGNATATPGDATTASDDAAVDTDDTMVDATDAAAGRQTTKSISEQIEEIRDDVAPATDGEADESAAGDAAGPGGTDDGSAARASPPENGQVDDETGSGVDNGSDLDDEFGVDDGDVDAAGDDSDTAASGVDALGGGPAAPDRQVLRRAAEDLADGWSERDLDFTPASLPRLDTFVDEQWDGRFRASSLQNRTVHHEERGDPLVQLGAYYAEVLIRSLGGVWVATDDGEGAIEVPDVGERTERVDVFAAARECLVPPSTFAYRYDALVNRIHADEPAVSDGRADVFDDDRATLTSGDVITQFAATAEDVVEEWEKYPLDYSPRSVRALDEIVDWLTEDVDLADVPLADGTDPESLRLTARATSLGAYYAAVLLRHRDAQWRIDGDDVELVLDRPDGERTIDPVATATDALRGEGSFAATYEALDD